MAHQIPSRAGDLGHASIVRNTAPGIAVPMPAVGAGAVLTGYDGIGPSVFGPLGATPNAAAGTITIDVLGVWQVIWTGRCFHAAGAGIFTQHQLDLRANGFPTNIGAIVTSHPILPRYMVGGHFVERIAAGTVLDLVGGMTAGGADATRVINYEGIHFSVSRIR